MQSIDNYYDIDAILAEEEVLPCTNLFEFSHLAHLDPDMPAKEDYLPEGSRLKMPLWSIEKWSTLGYIRSSMPKHFGRSARGRLVMDPTHANLRCGIRVWIRTGVHVVHQRNTSVCVFVSVCDSTYPLDGWRYPSSPMP